MAASGFGGGEAFPLSSAAGAGALKLHKGDITLWSVDGATDAIVSAPAPSHHPIPPYLLHARLVAYVDMLGLGVSKKSESSSPMTASLFSMEWNFSSEPQITRKAVVNAANERMLGGGGVDGAIHQAAGPQLVEACRKVPEVKPGVRCPTGEARITPAFELPVSRVIHTVGPIYDMDRKPEVSLKNAYENSLKLAKENGIQYIAFPAISCGIFRYPPKEASNIAISAAQQFSGDIKEVHFVLFSDDLYSIWRETAQEMLMQFEK
ncbi:hypothetical protein D1007_52738 [Hordeum vulgare]|nr:hypothetical protein D1007_52738 [Hordeum vulgare]